MLCCAGLMTILLVIGLMDLRVMAVVTAAITAERLPPAGERFAWAIGVVAVINREALSRAAHFAPPTGAEKVAFWIYQLATIFLLLYPVFLKIRPDSVWFYAGLAVYALAVLLLVVSTVNFAHPDKTGINTRGLYGDVGRLL